MRWVLRILTLISPTHNSWFINKWYVCLVKKEDMIKDLETFELEPYIALQELAYDGDDAVSMED